MNALNALKNKKNKWVLAGTLIMITIVVSMPAISHAQSAQSPSVCVSGAETLPCRIQQLFNVGIGLIGFIALVGVIYGGFQYMTSAGNAEKSGRAKATIISSITGLVLAILSVSILNIFSPQFTRFSADWFLPDGVQSTGYDSPNTCINEKWTCGYVKKSDGKYYCVGPEKNSCSTTLTSPPGEKKLHDDCRLTSDCAAGLTCKSYYVDENKVKQTCEYASCKEAKDACTNSPECCGGGKWLSCSRNTCQRGGELGLYTKCTPGSIDPKKSCMAALECKTYQIDIAGNTESTCENPNQQCSAYDQDCDENKPCCGGGNNTLSCQAGKCYKKQ